MNSRWQVFSLSKSECLTQPIKVQLSPNFKVFPDFCAPFLEATLHFEHSEKKDDPHSWFI